MELGAQGICKGAIVSHEDFDAAVLRAVAGVEKKRSIMIEAEKEVVSRHEVGHALVASAISQVGAR
eukprot:1157712-Pelagomonas_calceolata.AAC.2